MEVNSHNGMASLGKLAWHLFLYYHGMRVEFVVKVPFIKFKKSVQPQCVGSVFGQAALETVRCN